VRWARDYFLYLPPQLDWEYYAFRERKIQNFFGKFKFFLKKFFLKKIEGIALLLPPPLVLSLCD
jgi:hypothetical protein